MATPIPTGAMRADCITELEEIIGDVAGVSDQDRRTAAVHRDHPFAYEPVYLRAARTELAAAYDRLADIRDAYRAAARRALTDLERNWP